MVALSVVTFLTLPSILLGMIAPPPLLFRHVSPYWRLAPVVSRPLARRSPFQMVAPIMSAWVLAGRTFCFAGDCWLVDTNAGPIVTFCAVMPRYAFYTTSEGAVWMSIAAPRVP